MSRHNLTRLTAGSAHADKYKGRRNSRFKRKLSKLGSGILDLGRLEALLAQATQRPAPTTKTKATGKRKATHA